MQFELLTLTGAKYSGEATEVVVNTASGSIAVYAMHEPLTTIVLPGSISVMNKAGKTEVYTTFGGLLEFQDNVCRVLSDESEHSEELVEKEIEDALNAALKQQENAKDKHELAHAQALVDRHTVRLGVAKLKRHRRER
jgi:F-type H+-transporting ATPase subunit epsilon